LTGGGEGHQGIAPGSRWNCYGRSSLTGGDDQLDQLHDKVLAGQRVQSLMCISLLTWAARTS